jgi:hypothetical protein
LREIQKLAKYFSFCSLSGKNDPPIENIGLLLPSFVDNGISPLKSIYGKFIDFEKSIPIPLMVLIHKSALFGIIP